jgi:hypothetical protein
MQTNYAQVDQKKLAMDIDAIKKTIGEPTYEDLLHLRKVEHWGIWRSFRFPRSALVVFIDCIESAVAKTMPFSTIQERQ